MGAKCKDLLNCSFRYSFGGGGNVYDVLVLFCCWVGLLFNLRGENGDRTLLLLAFDASLLLIKLTLSTIRGESI